MTNSSAIGITSPPTVRSTVRQRQVDGSPRVMMWVAVNADDEFG